MPVGRGHYPNDILDIGIWDLGLKEIAHTVHKDRSRPRPLERFGKLFWDKAEVKPLFVRMSFYAAEALGKGLRVTMFASRADFGAAPERVPGGICPFDLGFIAHNGTIVRTSGRRQGETRPLACRLGRFHLFFCYFLHRS